MTGVFWVKYGKVIEWAGYTIRQESAGVEVYLRFELYSTRNARRTLPARPTKLL